MPSPDKLQKIIDELQEKADKLNRQAVEADNPPEKERLFLSAINFYKITLETKPPKKTQILQLHLSMLFCYDMLIASGDKKSKEDCALKVLEIIRNFGIDNINSIANHAEDIHHQSDFCTYFLNAYKILQQSDDQAVRNKINLREAEAAANKIIMLYPLIEKEYNEIHSSKYKRDYLDCHALDKEMAQEFLTPLTPNNSPITSNNANGEDSSEESSEEIVELNLDEPFPNKNSVSECSTTISTADPQKESPSAENAISVRVNPSPTKKRKFLPKNEPPSQHDDSELDKSTSASKRPKVRFVGIGEDDSKGNHTKFANRNDSPTNTILTKFFPPNNQASTGPLWIKIVKETLSSFEVLQKYNKQIVSNIFYDIASCHLVEFNHDQRRNKKHLQWGYTFLELAHKLDHKTAADKQDELFKQVGFKDKQTKTGLWAANSPRDNKTNEIRKINEELQSILFQTSRSTTCVQHGATLDINNAEAITSYLQDTFDLYITKWLPAIYQVEKHMIKFASILMSKFKLSCSDEEQKKLFRNAEAKLKNIFENETAPHPQTTQTSLLPL